MINPYEFALKRIKKIVNYDATEEEKLEALDKTLVILSTKVKDKNWFYNHPSFNDRFYSDYGTEKTSNKINLNNPWHLFYVSLLSVTSLKEVVKEIWFLENSTNYRDWIVENVRKKRILS
jgi:hypothetical protein